MSEELKRYVEDALYKWIKKQIEEGNFRANLRIEIDNPIEVRGMKGRLVGEIIISDSTNESLPPMHIYEPKKADDDKDDKDDKGSGDPKGSEEMSLADVDKLLKSLGV